MELELTVSSIWANKRLLNQQVPWGWVASLITFPSHQEWMEPNSKIALLTTHRKMAQATVIIEKFLNQILLDRHKIVMIRMVSKI